MTPFMDDGDMRLYVGDCLDMLRQLPDESVDCCVTSPPYWGLRDYGTGEWDGGDPDCDHAKSLVPRALDDPGIRRSTLEGGKKTTTAQAEGSQFRDVCGKCGARRVDRQLGLEPTPDEYVRNMVAVFREVRRVLAPHGTCWVNLGDSYIAAQGGRQSAVGEMPAAPLAKVNTSRERDDVDTGAWADRDVTAKMTPARGTTDLKPKDLAGIPWRVAFALQADGWWLRSDIVWSKPNPMPESVTDRPTKAHEYLFLLTKQPRYWFDAEAVREPLNHASEARYAYGFNGYGTTDKKHVRYEPGRNAVIPAGRNVRSVWEIATQPFPGAHFATFPEELARKCIVAGCPEWVCGVCGKPRERIVRNEYRKPDAGGGSTGFSRSLQEPNGRQNGTGMAGKPRLTKEPVTLGWSDCGHNAYRPGRVLDPFAGAGTVGLVARKHARHSVLIELSEQYAREILLPRLSQLSLLAEIV